MNHCGECKQCCKALGIEELVKPADTWCSFACDAGCSIYKNRPPSCAAYKCVWLMTQEEEIKMPLELRPDICGVVIDTMSDDVLQARVDSDTPDIWKEGPIGEFLAKMAQVVPIIVGVTGNTQKKLLRSVDDNTVVAKTIHLRKLPNGNMEYHAEDQK